MELKKPLTIEEQLERLTEHRMLIGPVDEAKAFLSTNNYYRISGYALQYRDPLNSDFYVDSLFAYVLALMLRLPSDEDRIEMRREIEDLIDNAEPCVNLNMIGFPHNYKTILDGIVFSSIAAPIA